MSKEQFTSVILPLQHKLYRYALSIVYEVPLAEDIVQEVFMKLWDQRARLTDIEVEQLDSTFYQLAAASFPDKMASDRDLIVAIKKMTEGLPEKQKEIFWLREILGYSNAEIEEIMALDSNQVKVNLFRARKKIKSKLTQLINYGLKQ